MKPEAPQTSEPEKDKSTESELSIFDLPKSPAELSQWLAEVEKFVKQVAENLRYGSWTKRLIIIGGISIFALNPFSADKVARMLGEKSLPSWYKKAFVWGMSGFGVATLGVAIITLPKPKTRRIQSAGAIKGLQSFNLNDAKVFAELGREGEIKKYWRAISNEEFRFGVLQGESGCGKSSLLQAGLLPRLIDKDSPYFGVYIKLRSQDVIADIRRELEKRLEGEGIDAGETNASTTENLVNLLKRSVERAGKPIVLIVDQFEQFFVQNNSPDKRKPFIADLKAWYDGNLDVKILVGIRKDWSGDLEEIREDVNFTSDLSNVFTLRKFIPKQATQVLKVIAEKENLKDFNEKFIKEQVMEQLAARDGYVSPVDVQLLAVTIIEQPDPDLRAFNEKVFDKCGGVEGLLTRFLEQTITAQLNLTSRQVAKEVLLALINFEQNVRAKPLSLNQLQKKLEDRDKSVVLNTVQWLSNPKTRLVTRIKLEEKENNEEIYELAHERLIPAIRQIAGKELSAANRANLLLNERVSRWVGSGYDKTFLFSFKELCLLWQQRRYLSWGANENQKKRLLSRSWWRLYCRLGILSIPILALASFGVWSHTKPGQLQWARWKIMEISKYVNVYQNTAKAIALDRIVTGQDNHLGIIRFFQYYNSSSDIRLEASKPLKQVVEMADEMKNTQLANNLLSKVRIAIESSGILSEVETLRMIAEVYVKLNEREKANQTLQKAFEYSVELTDPNVKRLILKDLLKLNKREKYKQMLEQAYTTAKSLFIESYKDDALSAIAEAYIKLNDSNKAKQILKEAQAKSLFQKLNIGAKTARDARTLSTIAKAYIDLSEPETAQQLLEEALLIAKSLQEESSKVYALEAIIEVSVKLGNDQKAKLFLEETLSIIQTFQEESDQAYGLKAIAKASSQLGNSQQGKQMLSLAFAIAKSFQDESNKANTISAIAEGYIALNSNTRAEQLLKQVLKKSLSTKSFQDESNKYGTLRVIIAAFKKIDDGKDKELEELVKQALTNIPSKYKEAYAINDITKASEKFQLGETEEAKQLIEQASTMAISDPEFSYYEIANIVEELIETSKGIGDIKEGRKVLEKALTIANSFGYEFHEHSQAYTLTNIAEAYIDLNNSDKARQIVKQAFLTAESFKDESDKVYSFRRIAETYIKLKDSDKSRQTLEQTLQITKSLKEESLKVTTLKVIVETYIKLNDSEQVKQVLEQALLMAQSFQDESNKVDILEIITKTSDKISDRDQVDKLLEQSLSMVKTFQYKSNQANGQIMVARAYINLNDSSRARQSLERGLLMAESSKDESEKAATLIRIADVYRQLNNISKSKSLTEEAKNLAEKYGTSETAIRDIAFTYTKLGNIGEALDFSQKFKSDVEIGALASILHAHAEQKNSEFKKLWSE